MRTSIEPKKKISIVSSATDETASNLATLLISILMKNMKSKFQFYIIDKGISLRSKLLLNRTIGMYDAKINYLTVEEDWSLLNLKVQNLPFEQIYRCVIPHLIPDHTIEKVLYLNNRMLVLDSILPLWNTALRTNLLAAVEDVHYIQHLKEVSTNVSPHFNIDLMFINVKKWRESKISEKVLQFMQQNASENLTSEQDALNAILWDQWLALHPQWNAQTSILLNEHKHPTLIGNLQYRETRKHPIIVHFDDENLDSLSASNHPFAAYYQFYQNETTFEPQVTNKYIEKNLT